MTLAMLCQKQLSYTARSIQQCQPVHFAYQLRQGAGATTTRSDVKAKSDEVANFKLDKANQESQIIILQGKLEDARHANSNVVEMANVQKPSKITRFFSLARDHAAEKAKATLDVSRGRIEAAIQPKEAALQKAKDLLAAAREKLDLLKAEEAEKAQVVQEAHEGLKAAQERLVAAENVFLTLKMLQNYWSKPNLFYQLLWLI